MGSGAGSFSPSAPLRVPTSATVPAGPSSGGLMVMVTSLAHALGCGALRPNIANWVAGARVLMGSIDPGPTCRTAPRGRSSRPGALPQRRRPAWAITVVMSAELVPCLDRLRFLVAGQRETEKRAAGGCQPAWIAGRPALVGRLGACRSHPQAPGFGPPSRPSAWPAPAEPEPAAALVSRSRGRVYRGCWPRPQGPARSRLAAGPCPPSACAPPQDVAVEPLPPPAPVGCAARLGRRRQS